MKKISGNEVRNLRRLVRPEKAKPCRVEGIPNFHQARIVLYRFPSWVIFAGWADLRMEQLLDKFPHTVGLSLEVRSEEGRAYLMASPLLGPGIRKLQWHGNGWAFVATKDLVAGVVRGGKSVLLEPVHGGFRLTLP